MRMDQGRRRPSDEPVDVQIKITAKRSIGLRHPCNHLIIFRVLSPAEAEIFYDGPGTIVWENAGPMQSNGQRSISLTKIESLRLSAGPE